MGIYLNPNNSYFKEIASSGVYVDKSGLISFLNSRIGKPRPYIASSRPRRFGKSLSDCFTKLAYITGILPIKKYGTQSALNNFRELTMVEPQGIAPYIGFTEKEVMDLCEASGMPYSEMQKWYDGYQFTKTEWKNGEKFQQTEHIYCPNSVMEAIDRKDFNSYWSKTETYEALKIYIEMNFDNLKDKVIRMLAGERCPIKVNTFKNDLTTMSSADDVLTLLVHPGSIMTRTRKNMNAGLKNIIWSSKDNESCKGHEGNENERRCGEMRVVKMQYKCKKQGFSLLQKHISNVV